MSRSGYSDDIETWSFIKWRGRVTSAFRGRRGQCFLRDLLTALDAMPNKRLVGESLVEENGEVCTLGCIARARGLDVSDIDFDYDEDLARKQIAECLDIAEPMAAEIMFENDEILTGATPESRWERMRNWVARQIIVTPEEANAVEEPTP